MSVSACIPCGPKCLRWKLFLEPGNVAHEFLILSLMGLVFCGERGVKVWLIG